MGIHPGIVYRIIPAVLLLLLSISQIIILPTLRHKLNSRFDDYDSTLGFNSEIHITTLESIEFIEKDNKEPKYYPGIQNLGFAGNLILDCYSGLCTEELWKNEPIEDCDDDGCGYIDNYVKYYPERIDYKCSFECFELKGHSCNNCTNPKYKYINSIGNCSRNLDDKECSDEKYCMSDNVLYFWKGRKYEGKFIQKKYYLKDVVLENEECPSKTKNCGIIDSNGNKLCISEYSVCPINIISEEKRKNSYSSFKFGNKTFYYGKDENTNNTKIIAGIYVDTDIYLNKTIKNFEILDTNKISELLEENQKLYQGVDLGFDPYKNKDIDKKGKSYLKVKYNENIDLISLRNKQQSALNRTNFRNTIIRSVTDKFNAFNVVGIVGYSYFIFIILVIVIPALIKDEEKDIKMWIFLIIFTSIPFLTLSLFPTIKSCCIVDELNQINNEIGISSATISRSATTATCAQSASTVFSTTRTAPYGRCDRQAR